MAGAGVIETRAVRVAKLCQHHVGETQRLVQPFAVKRRSVQSEQTVDEERIVLEEASDARITVLPTAQKLAVALQMIDQCGSRRVPGRTSLHR